MILPEQSSLKMIVICIEMKYNQIKKMEFKEIKNAYQRISDI